MKNTIRALKEKEPISYIMLQKLVNKKDYIFGKVFFTHYWLVVFIQTISLTDWLELGI